MGKIEENEIEELAQKYFVSNQKDKKTGYLLTSKINKAEFVRQIFFKGIRNYNNQIDDPAYIKDESISKTMMQAVEYYKPENGPFINYFSVNLKFNIGNVIKNEIKKKEKLGKNEILRLNASVGDENNTPLENLIKDEKNKTPENEFYEKNEKTELVEECKKLFSAINKFYLFSKAGRKNKSVVYTYIVLEYLLSLYPKDLLIKYIEEYDFLLPQKALLSVLWDDNFANGTIPSQDEYAKITGTASSKFAGFKFDLKNFLIEEKVG